MIVNSKAVGYNDINMRISAKPSLSSLPTRKVTARHHVVILVFDQAQLLDVAGPADAFVLANDFHASSRYTVTCASVAGGCMHLSNGLTLDTRSTAKIKPSSVDTLIVAGAQREGLMSAMRDTKLKSWATKVAASCTRVSSVCVGSFALAQWGLLDHRKATSHWTAVKRLQSSFPHIYVDPSAIFVQDGKYWTAGGVTTGIDMALAMIEKDTSKLIAGQVASMLVMSARRLGNQAQYSSVLKAQSGRYASLIDWIDTNLDQHLDVASLAAKANESERSFCRRFVAEVGQTPGAFVEDLRVNAAKRALQGGASAKATAKLSGFSSPEHLARVFRKRLDMSPLEYRSHHASEQ
jgi:transcriptional regulator GlxA family with amidase domain